MKRFLVLDDHSQIAATIVAALPPEQLHVQAGVAQCLKTLEESDFPLLLCDIETQGPQGLLLATVRQRFPQMVRVGWAQHTGAVQIGQHGPLAHQVLTQLDAASVQTLLQRIRALTDILQSQRLRVVVADVGTLPSVPLLYWQLTQRMNDPNSGPRDIARIIEQDPAMAARVLQLANSPLFGLGRSIVQIGEAIVYLGVHVVRDLIIMNQAFAAFENVTLTSFSVRALQQHSVLTARLARTLLKGSPEAAKQAFVAGLLHDIGKLVLASQMPSTFARATQLAVAEGLSYHAAEQSVFGTTHAELGAYLMAEWGLPYCPIVEAVAWHHTPLAANPKLNVVSAVHIASLLADHVCAGGAQGKTSLALLEDLVLPELPTWIELAQREAASVMRVQP